jgi:DNA-binding NarL/FixJ family response regulator
VEEDAFHDLSERELEVLYEVSLGKTNAEIAQSLNLSEKTARNYVSVILEKLQLSNRIELATYAIKNHLSERMKRE